MCTCYSWMVVIDDDEENKSIAYNWNKQKKNSNNNNENIEAKRLPPAKKAWASESGFFFKQNFTMEMNWKESQFVIVHVSEFVWTKLKSK